MHKNKETQFSLSKFPNRRILKDTQLIKKLITRKKEVYSRVLKKN